MCGIVGVINAGYNAKARKFLQDGGVVGQVRGFDSTGIAQQKYDGKISTFKIATIGTYFTSDKAVDGLLTSSSGIGYSFIHHRAATSGKVTVANAHPFTIQRLDEPKGKETQIVGVHNGSLDNWKHKHNGKVFEVDSEWALSRIADIGDDAFKEIEGPYAFVWGDTAKKHVLSMCRNYGRPMHVVFSKDRKSVYFASEAGMLAWLCERNDIEVENEILALEAGQIYEFDSTGATVVVRSRKAPTVVPTNNVSTFSKKDKEEPVKQKDTTPRYVNNTTAYTVNRPPYVAGDPAKEFIDKLKAACKPKTLEQQVDNAVAAITEDVEIVEQRDDDSPVAFDGEKVPPQWFNEDGVTTAERKAAADAGLFRELNWLEGVCWDEETGDLLGDVQVFVPGEGKHTFVGVLRGISRSRAEAEYINNAKAGLVGNWVVCTGLRDDPVCGKVVIVSELNREGKQGLAKLHANGY